MGSKLITYQKYDVVSCRLILGLRGREYVYFDVPSYIVHGLNRAESKGRYYNQYIKGNFRQKEREDADV